jgi:presenilin-like A22 family membrane protease
MKHTLKITLLLVFIFFITQVIGLSITNKYIDHKTTAISGKVAFEALPYDMERPEIEESTSYIWIISAVIIGTLLLLIIIKFRKKINIIVRWILLIILILGIVFTFFNILLKFQLYLVIRLIIYIFLLYTLTRFKEKFDVWKLWFFLAVFFTMAIAFAAFIPQTLAAILAFALAIIKIYKPITTINNLTEIFIYGGLAAIFVPVINLFAAFALLFLISVYDIIAVRHTKHMVKLAKFQAKSNVFAGLFIPYKSKGNIVAKEKGIIQKKGAKIAVLGGGDIGFPLLFAGVVMKGLMLTNTELIGFIKTLIIPIFVSLALLYLLVRGQKNKFYPAMPYLTAGCVIGYLVILLFF